MDSPSKILPPRPDLGHLKHQAEDLREAFARGDPDARQRVKSVAPLRHLAAALVGLTVSQAQLVVAREYGFASWPELKAHVEHNRKGGTTMNATQEARQIDGIKSERQVITDRVVMRAIVGGAVDVESGGDLEAFGPIGGVVTVEAGGKADLYGPVGGTILNRGGTIMLRGAVGGSIKAEAGTTYISSGVAVGGDVVIEAGATVESAGQVQGRVDNRGGTLIIATGGRFGTSSISPENPLPPKPLFPNLGNRPNQAPTNLDWLGPMLEGVLGGLGKSLGGVLGGGIGAALSGGLPRLEALEGLSEFEMMSELEVFSKLSVLDLRMGASTEASRPVEERVRSLLKETGDLTGAYATKVQEVAGKRVEAKAKGMEVGDAAQAASAKLHAEADALKVEAKAIIAQAKAKLDEAVKLAEEAKRLRQAA